MGILSSPGSTQTAHSLTSIRVISLVVLCLFFVFNSYSQNASENSPSGIQELYNHVSEAHKDDSEILCGLYYDIATYYSRRMSYDSAYKYFSMSLFLANETSNKVMLAEIYNRIGGFYYQCEDFDEARTFMKKCNELYNELKHPEGIARSSNNMGEIERLDGDVDKALDFYFQAQRYNLESDNYTNLSLNHNNIGLTYTHMHEYDSALYHLNLARHLAESHKINSTINNIYNSLGTYYWHTGNYDSCYYYFSHAYRQSVKEDLVYQIRINSQNLSELFDELGLYDSAYFYHRIYKKFNDSIVNHKNIMRMGLLVISTQMENEKQMARIEQSRRESYYIIAFVSIILILIILLLLWTNQRNQTHHTQLKNDHLALEKRLLNNELTTFALHISENNRFLEELRAITKSLKTTSENEKLVTSLRVKLNTGLSDLSNKEVLDQKVNEQQRGFIQKLKNEYPTLTKSELKLCAFLRLNLSTKDIAGINKVSPQAIKVARYRLRKKMNLDSNIDFADYFIKFEESH